MRRYLFLTALCASVMMSCLPLWGITVEEKFAEANSLYAGSDYAGAVSLYEEIAAAGVESGDVYYNLGNAYYKLGKKGKAILNYERAVKYMPADEDLFANYSFVRTLLDIKQPVEDHAWHEKLFLAVRSLFSTEGWFVISGLLYLGIFIILGFSLYSYRLRRQLFMAAASSVILFVLSIFMFSGSYREYWKTSDGIIVDPKVQVRYSPSYSGAVAFEAAEGMKAGIVREQEGWSLIRMTRKNTGWIESDSIEKI